MATLQQLEKALVAADAAGAVDDARILASEIRKMRAAPVEAPKPALGDGQGLLRQFAQSASFGFDDELAGAVSAATGGDYQSARDSYRKERDQYGAENPGKSMLAGLAGGVATGIGGGGLLAATRQGQAAINAYRAAAPMAQFAANVGTGAAGGAVAGIGNADDGSRLAGALSGGVIGGATGGLVQPVAWAGKKALDALSGPARWAADKIAMGPEEQFMRKLAQQLQRDGMTPRRAEARLRQLGPSGMLADVSENVTGLAEGYAALPGAAKTAAKSALTRRAAGQSNRVVQSAMGGLDLTANDLNFDGQIRGIHEAMREVGKGYAPLVDSVETPMNEKIEKLLQGPTMKSALAKAFHIAQNDVALGDADSTVQKYFALNDRGEGMFMPFGGQFAEVKQRPTLRVWDYAKRGLDAIIGDGTDPITGKLTNEARQALMFKNKLLAEIDAVAPEYKKVRAAYADQFSLESALKLGRAFANKDSEVTARFLEEMSDPEKAMFRAGAARALRDKVLSAPDTGDSYKRIFGNPLMRERIRAIFPNEQAFNSFARDINREATFGQTKNAVLGNSRTAIREALKDDAGVDPAVMADVMNGNVPALALRLASNRLQSAVEVPEAVREIGAKYLFATDPATKREALSKLQKQAQILMNRRKPSPASLYTPAASALLGAEFGGAAQ